MLITSPDTWAATLATTGLPPLRSRAPLEGAFRGRMVTGRLGPVHIAGFDTPPGDCVRDEDGVRDRDRPFCQVDMIVAGQARVEQPGGTAELSAGDLVVVDPARPVRVRSGWSRHLSLLVPRRLLEADTRALAGRRLSGAHGSGALMMPLVKAALGSIETFAPQEATRTGTMIAGVLDSALAGQFGDPGHTEDETLRTRVRAHITARLHDPGLSPGSVAAAHHISLSRLHKLFRDQPLTVAALIRAGRLERCRDDLVAGRLPVAVVGTRWGFTDPAHFSRAFKAAYGTSPSGYRRRYPGGMSPRSRTDRHGGAH
ncbi:AraC-like ligand-binding domain-containing protein [Kineosporia succinea]|uniref:AraC-like DNA-binding protein n=1 Tax=Kineosporia succinea TaxID=84632 RepID=A0ABT9PDP7_9ACTN|nr:helix-turn-helix domain-containing protein [Kineosporia succinea]MDP9830823.1 AraC-like DNA-binding protein [Kineosporia succinea]